MIRAKITMPNSDSIYRLIDTMAHPDFTPLAERCREIMLQDNREGLERGEDIFGDTMEPIKESTRKRRGGEGPPLIPNYGGSRLINDYQVVIEQGFDRTILIGSWPNSPFVKYHVHGFVVHSKNGDVGVPSRDPVGIRPEGQAMIAVALEEFCISLVAGAGTS